MTPLPSRFLPRRAPWAALLLPLALAGCALPRPPATPDVALPTAWQAPRPPAPAAVAPATDPSLPHGGSADGMARWWERAGDPLLVELVGAAQAASPTLAQAASRIGQARASRVAAGAALGPTLDAVGNLSRGFQPQFLAVATTAQGNLQAGWEPDVFGGNRAARDAAQARLEGAQAGWHDARVSVAAETANQLTALRACREQLVVATDDARSRRESARLSALTTQAGFQAPADDALARASAADAGNRLLQQQAQCDVAVKGLVALTAIDETVLRQKLDAAPVAPVPDALFSIAELPAQVLAQRPDIAIAARDVVAASADVANAEAQRYPRLTIGGAIGRFYVDAPQFSGSSTTWTAGPLQLSLPLFDGGRRAANTAAARAKYDEAVALYRARVRQAVREVEEALVNLRATADRAADAETAAAGYRASFEGFQARYDAGLASQIQLEDARRTALAAETTRVNLKRERMAAWIALYRAAGGGWEPSAAAPGDSGATVAVLSPAEAPSAPAAPAPAVGPAPTSR
ncbi:efflux transporter outer membrane subunit [uncultured Xylophilus sp.]|uniref:efflux transporter outer membrane subunit n=1 Tax=uncultured Xylophilus sp. TaxID=296832 RepID=UPI0025FA8686|nr:efflux transporter outer membrane subunit [uncultured Xylophilus sp.]